MDFAHLDRVARRTDNGFACESANDEIFPPGLIRGRHYTVTKE